MLKIVSDGTVEGTEIVLGRKKMRNVTRVVIDIDAKAGFVRATIEVVVKVNVQTDEKNTKIIERKLEGGEG